MGPRSEIIRWDYSFSYGEFNLEANRQGFVGHRIFPAPVQIQAGKFLRVKVASLLTPIESTLRNANGTFNRSTFEFDQDDYATQDHGVEETVDNRQVAIYSDVIRAEYFARERAVNRVLQAYENDACALAMDTANIDHAAAGQVSGGDTAIPWTDVNNATPLEDFDAACEKIATKIGRDPNKAVMTKYTLKKLVRTTQITGLLKFSGYDDPKALARALPALAELLQLEEIIIAQGWKNTSDETAAGPASPTLVRLWDPTKVLVLHVGTSEDVQAPEPTLGRTFMWNKANGSIPGSDSEEGIGCLVEEYYEPQRDGGVIRARNDRQIKPFHYEAGYLITDCTEALA